MKIILYVIAFISMALTSYGQTAEEFDGFNNEQLISYFKENGITYSIEGIWLFNHHRETTFFDLTMNPGKTVPRNYINDWKEKKAFVKMGEQIDFLSSEELNDNSVYSVVISRYLKPTPNNSVYLMYENSSIPSIQEVKVEGNLISWETKKESRDPNSGILRTIYIDRYNGIRIAPTDRDLLTTKQSGNKLTFPIKAMDNMHYLTVDIAGESYSYLIDSGASYISITPKMEDRMKTMGILRDSDYHGVVELEMADNSATKLKKVMIPVIKIGSQTVSNVEAVISDGSLLLGRSLINKFKSWSIDNYKNILTVETY